ncbi:MAG: flagellar hook capping FlgD N-terminal domain-containing protein [Pirellulaceae bacterium]|nr:flagellar hook capping FlgD N-terminal domain-containing protein [Pirellulaceae bacterium]
MSTINNVPSTTPLSIPSPQAAKATSVNELSSNDFLKLLIAELKNQDPMAPTDSVQMLQQISQIRQITSNDAMTATMNSVQMGQDVATASQMVGKRISALDQNHQEVEGVVSRVTFSPAGTNRNSGREIRLHVGEQQVEMSKVRSILPSTA